MSLQSAVRAKGAQNYRVQTLDATRAEWKTVTILS